LRICIVHWHLPGNGLLLVVDLLLWYHPRRAVWPCLCGVCVDDVGWAAAVSLAGLVAGDDKDDEVDDSGCAEGC